MKRIPQLAILVVMLLSFFDTAVKAEATIIVDHPTDFWFDYSEPTHFVARTYQSGNSPSDPQLWLYTESGNLIFTNDDFYGLQSNIDMWIVAGRYRLRASTCCYEPDVWRSDASGVWNVRYELYYDGLQTEPTTTTEAPTTTTEVTTSTSTEAPTTTILTIPPTTTLPEEPTWPPTTESTPPTTTSTTTVPTTTVPVTEPPTPSTDVPTTVVPATTTEPPTPEPVTVPATDPQTTDTPITIEPELPSDPPTTPPEAPETTLPPEIPSETAQAILDDIGEELLTEEQFADVIESLTSGDLTQDEIQQIVEALLNTEITADQATDLATNAEILETVTADQANDIFDAVVISELTDEEAAEIIEAVQNAPSEVREAFETQINVFDGTFDTYTPLGSAIPVSTRRTVTAAIAAIGITTPISSRKKTK